MFSWLVHLLIFIFYPISWPISKLFERILGKQSGGTIYKREELKELLNILENENLSSQEVRILKGVLDLGHKNPIDIMTPLDHVFMVENDQLLDRNLMAEIVLSGHSRVPVYFKERTNILGYLIVKKLLVLDSEDSVPISKIPLTKIPKFQSSKSLFEIIAEFQQGNCTLLLNPF